MSHEERLRAPDTSRKLEMSASLLNAARQRLPGAGALQGHRLAAGRVMGCSGEGLWGAPGNGRAVLQGGRAAARRLCRVDAPRLCRVCCPPSVAPSLQTPPDPSGSPGEPAEPLGFRDPKPRVPGCGLGHVAWGAGIRAWAGVQDVGCRQGCVLGCRARGADWGAGQGRDAGRDLCWGARAGRGAGTIRGPRQPSCGPGAAGEGTGMGKCPRGVSSSSPQRWVPLQPWGAQRAPGTAAPRGPAPVCPSSARRKERVRVLGTEACTCTHVHTHMHTCTHARAHAAMGCSPHDAWLSTLSQRRAALPAFLGTREPAETERRPEARVMGRHWQGCVW